MESLSSGSRHAPTFYGTTKMILTLLIVCNRKNKLTINNDINYDEIC